MSNEAKSNDSSIIGEQIPSIFLDEYFTEIKLRKSIDEYREKFATMVITKNSQTTLFDMMITTGFLIVGDSPTNGTKSLNNILVKTGSKTQIKGQDIIIVGKEVLKLYGKTRSDYKKGIMELFLHYIKEFQGNAINTVIARTDEH